MPKQKSYNLLCPIARALDAVGDRWSLLILRDLHAGPARFADLQSGLTGIASNLLTDRLAHLAGEGLIEKVASPHGGTLYQLTEAGRGTRSILFELARLGGHLTPVPEPKRPGNLRTVAVTFSAALDRVIPPDLQAEAELTVEGEAFTIRIADGRATVTAGAHPDAPLKISTTYQALVRAASGDMPFDTFIADHAEVCAPDDAARDVFLSRVQAAMAQMQ